MKSRWNDTEFQSVVEGYVKAGLNRDLAIRTYTTRLLGVDPEMVLHGGGNTSVKTIFTEADGSEVSGFASRAAAGTWAPSNPRGCQPCV